uniref:UBX domain protein 11 n=1 Tax=Nothobranchius rachovii TaxID=451742 RepID=A0A1A8QZS0_9TELE
MLHKTASGAKLAKKDPVPLKLYRNGIEMFDGPFKAPSAACRTSWVTASLLSSSRDFQMVSLLRRSHLLPTILVFHPGSQEEADHRSEKAVKAGVVIDIRNSLRETAEPNGSGFDILSMHPRCIYNDDDMMIQFCGLSANSTVLLLRRRKLTGLQR